MRKNILWGILFVLILFTITACGQTTPQKSREELEAEVRAEMEAEKNTAADRSFEDIFTSDGLKMALEYYDQHHSAWDHDLKRDFLIKIISELGQRTMVYTESLEGIEQDDEAVPPLLQYEDWLYQSVYDARSNTLYLGSLNDELKAAVKKVLTDDVFILAKLYYIDQGNIEDLGFTAIIPFDISLKLEEWAGGLDEEIDFYEYDLIRYPNGFIKAEDTQWNPSDHTYHNVYVESKESLELLLPGSKAEAYLKVNTDEGERLLEESSSSENDLSQGYVYRVEDGTLKLKYNNTGNEIDLVQSRPVQKEDMTTLISDFLNIQKSHDGARLFFEVPAFAATNAIHVVDLNSLEEKFFTDGFFVQNVGQEPYLDAVIVLKVPMTDAGRGAIYYLMDAQGETICELGSTLNRDHLMEQITASIE